MSWLYSAFNDTGLDWFQLRADFDPLYSTCLNCLSYAPFSRA